MRLLTFIILFFISVLVTPAIAFFCALMYAFSYVAYELLIIGVCIDAYFGVASSVPYYTITALLILLFAEGIKPRLSFYTS